MEERRIESEMAELAKLIAYPSEDVGQLAIAMRATPEGDDQFCLSGYETIGDAMLKGLSPYISSIRGKPRKPKSPKPNS